MHKEKQATTLNQLLHQNHFLEVIFFHSLFNSRNKLMKKIQPFTNTQKPTSICTDTHISDHLIEKAASALPAALAVLAAVFWWLKLEVASCSLSKKGNGNMGSAWISYF